MRNKPNTSDRVLDWKRTLQDDGWEVSSGKLAGFYVMDDMDRDEFLDDCDADDADMDAAEHIADLVWG